MLGKAFIDIFSEPVIKQEDGGDTTSHWMLRCVTPFLHPTNPRSHFCPCV